MKKRTFKEGIVFGGVAIISALLIWSTTLIGTHKTYPLSEEDCLRILFLGDSNYSYEMEGNTIPGRIGEQLNAEIYNCAVGGTTAAKLDTADYIDTKMDLFCLHNLVRLMQTNDVQSVRDFHGSLDTYGYHGMIKAEILDKIDLTQMDYIVISYGINDYTTGRIIYGDDKYDERTYAGALRGAIESIQKMCPDVKIILSSITYCAFGGEAGPEDGYLKSWGGGTIDEYRDATALVASEYENVYFMDNLKELPITYDNYKQYLCDGLHLNAEGQKIYTDYFVSVIEKIESDANE